MKTIAIEVSADKSQCRIIEQSHRGQRFGLNSHEFVASNGFRLKSRLCPEDDVIFHRLFVRGSDKSLDHEAITIPNKQWLAGLRVAVAEYNAYPWPKPITEPKSTPVDPWIGSEVIR